MAATVGACALIGNVVGGYVIASRLSQLAAAPAAAALAGAFHLRRDRLQPPDGGPVVAPQPRLTGPAPLLTWRAPSAVPRFGATAARRYSWASRKAQI